MQMPPLVLDLAIQFCPVVSVDQLNEYVVCGWETGEVHIYDLCAPGKPPVVVLQAHAAPITALSWNVSGSMLVSADNDGFVAFWHRLVRKCDL